MTSRTAKPRTSCGPASSPCAATMITRSSSPTATTGSARATGSTRTPTSPAFWCNLRGLAVAGLAAQRPEHVVASLGEQAAQRGGRICGFDVGVGHFDRLERNRAHRVDAADEVLRHRRRPVPPNVPDYLEVLLPVRLHQL